MSFHWGLTLGESEATPEDLSAAGFDAEFPTQAEAERWLGEYYAELQDYGVIEVTLLELDRVVYGPMSLENEDQD